MPTRARPRSGALLGALLAVLPPWVACAAPFATPAAAQKAELREQQGELRERLDALRRDLGKSEESRAHAADQLKETESAISDANRGLRQLADQRGALEGELRDLESQSRRLAEQTAAQQEQLSRLLFRHYTRGERDALATLLAGGDPNRAALDRHFLRLLSRAKADLIADLRHKGQEKQRLAQAAKDKSAELAIIERRQQQARAGLIERQRQHRALLAGVADRIKAQRREIGVLQKDEKRLARLIEGLSRIVRQPARTATGAPRPAPALQAEPPPGSDQAGGVFAAQRGRLRLPVRGEIAGRFGKPRPEGGTTWKGLFIRAAEGGEVKAIAAGRIVHADWLRGFGNLLVIDHGDDFLSVYGNNQSLLKEAGQAVAAGEAVATVGNSGGSPESGLYFELRHQGQPFDPLRWVSQR